MKNTSIPGLTCLLIFAVACKNDLAPAYPVQKNVKDHVSENHEIHLNFISEMYATRVMPRGDYLEIGEAVDMMTEGLNSLYCRPGQKLFDSTFTYFDTISVAVNGSEEIHRDDIADAMDAFAEFAGDIFYDREVEDTSKVSWAFNVSQAAPPGGGSVDLAVMYIMQEGEPRDEEDSFPYEESWPWYYNEVEDETAECASPSVETGAEDLYRRDLRDALSYQWNKVSPPFYYLNLQFVTYVNTSANELPFLDEALIYAEYDLEELINSGDEEEEDNYFDYLLWHNATNLPNSHECLTVDEMNFHYQEMRDLIENDQPVGTDVIVNVEVGYSEIILGYTIREHTMQGWYADKITVTIGNEEPGSLPEN